MKENCALCIHHNVFWGGAGCNLINHGEKCKYVPRQGTAEGGKNGRY